MDPITVNFSVDSRVVNIAETQDGSNPTIAKYIAYDNLNPPNPFIATVQDGRGNVLFDGGFPKYYNMRVNSSWTSFSQLNDTFKYFHNALDWIANDDKVSEGNRKMLFLGDSNPGESYNIKQTGGSDFKTSIETMCTTGNWDPTYLTREDFSGGQIDLSYADLEPYVGVFLMSSRHTSNRYITQSTVDNLLAFREAGNGMFIITDHGSSADNGFYRTANFIAEELGAQFLGYYNRSPVNVGFLIDNYGNHPLWSGMDRSGYVHAGSSESEIIVDETPTTTTADSLTVSEQGFKTARFLIELDTGEKVFETYSYGLNAGDPITFNNDIQNGELKIGFGRTIDLDFDINLGIMDSASGLVRRNSDVIAQWSKDSGGMTTEWFTESGNSTIKVDDGDSIKVALQSPVYYAESFTINAAPRTSTAIDINLEDKTSKYISLSWTYDSRIELDHLELIFLKSDGSQIDIDDDGTLEDRLNLNKSLSFSASNLEPATEYKFKLRVYDVNGGSLDSSYYTAKTNGVLKILVDNTYKIPRNALVKKGTGWSNFTTQIKNNGEFEEIDIGPTIQTSMFTTDMWTEFSKEVRAIHLLDNDSDLYGSSLDIIDVIDSYGGTAELVKGASQVEDYVNFTSTDGPGQPAGFTYMVENTEGKRHIGHCRLNITEPPPLVANDDSFEIYEGGYINIYKSQMLDNDYDESGNEPIEIIGFSGVTGGTLTEYDNYIRFDVTSQVGEPAEFKYTITNAVGIETTAYVKLIIKKGLIAGIDNTDSYKDIEKTIPISTLDITDISENPPIKLIGVTDPSGGTVTFDDYNIYLTSTAAAGSNISFNYTVRNDINLTDTGTVNVKVMPTPQIQTADDTFEVTQGNQILISKSGLTNNDTDEGGYYPLTVTNVYNVTGGTLDVSGDTITFTSTSLAGEAAGFKYDVENTQGVTQTGNVYITVNPLPAVDSLIFSDAQTTQDKLNEYTPDSMQDVFTSWYRFSHQGGNIQVNPLTMYDGTTQYDLYSENIWKYHADEDRIACQQNTPQHVGFVSTDKYKNYVHEATLSSPGGDDDMIGIVLAYTETSNPYDEHTLIAQRTHGGIGGGEWAIIYNKSKSGDSVIINDSISGDDISGGWSGDRTRVRAEREGNIIKVYASPMNSTTLDPNSMFEIDLSSDSRLHKFMDGGSYGYCCLSQDRSTFTDIQFEGGLDKSIILDIENNIVWEYSFEQSQWIDTGRTIQDEIGYVREVYNPNTGDRYLVKENEIIKMT